MAHCGMGGGSRRLVLLGLNLGNRGGASYGEGVPIFCSSPLTTRTIGLAVSRGTRKSRRHTSMPWRRGEWFLPTRIVKRRCAILRGQVCSRASAHRPLGSTAWRLGFGIWSSTATLYRSRSTWLATDTAPIRRARFYHGGYGRRRQDREFDVLGRQPVLAFDRRRSSSKRRPSIRWWTGASFHIGMRTRATGRWRPGRWSSWSRGCRTINRSFFSVGFFLPHVPCYATQQWFDLYPTETLALPPFLASDRDDTPRFSWYLHWKLPEPRWQFLKEADEWSNLVRSYLACTSFVDSQVGRVLAALEKSGRADDTLIVLWSDHGWHLGEKQITGKNTLWDRSTRVPLIFAGPGVVSQGVCQRPAELLDIYPTLVELCDLPPRPDLEGHSLGPQLRDLQAARNWPAITTHNHDNHAVRSERWRYIRYADGSEELYDMQSDPNEWQNLADQPGREPVIREHRRWLPKTSARPAKGSAHRILTYENGTVNWEGQDVAKDAPIPELSPAR